MNTVISKAMIECENECMLSEAACPDTSGKSGPCGARIKVLGGG